MHWLYDRAVLEGLVGKLKESTSTTISISIGIDISISIGASIIIYSLLYTNHKRNRILFSSFLSLSLLLYRQDN